MVTNSHGNERRALPSLSEIEDGKHFHAISQYCYEKATSYDGSVELFKENIDRNVQKLAVKWPHASLKLGNTSGVITPESTNVFQDKANFEGMRRIASKKNGDMALRQAITKGKKSVAELKEELTKKDLQLVQIKTVADEKDRELREMSRFMATLKDVLHDMAHGGDAIAEQLNHLQTEHSPDIVIQLVSKLIYLSSKMAGLIDESALQVALKEQEREIDSLKEKITQLVQLMTSREMLADSLSSLNVDLVQTLNSLRQLIDEKDQVRPFELLCSSSVVPFSNSFSRARII
jgi:hypothetical protein